MSPEQIRLVLNQSRELAGLCTQNGWIDPDTISYEVIEQARDTVVLAVQFEEIIMEGSGCVADRRGCYGRVRIREGEGTDSLVLELL